MSGKKEFSFILEQTFFSAVRFRHGLLGRSFKQKSIDYVLVLTKETTAVLVDRRLRRLLLLIRSFVRAAAVL